MAKWLIIGLFLGGFSASADQELFPTKPDPDVTVGDYCDEQDPDFVGYRYEDKVPYCIRKVSRHRKTRVYNQYHVPEDCRVEYTVDHYIPLFMGGSNEVANLWPEHRRVKATRQNLEQQLYLELRNGHITQSRAIEVVTEAKMNPPQVAPSECHLKATH